MSGPEIFAWLWWAFVGVMLMWCGSEPASGKVYLSVRDLILEDRKQSSMPKESIDGSQSAKESKS